MLRSQSAAVMPADHPKASIGKSLSKLRFLHSECIMTARASGEAEDFFTTSFPIQS